MGRYAISVSKKADTSATADGTDIRQPPEAEGGAQNEEATAVKAQSKIISSMPSSFESDRAELLDLLVKRVILYRSESQPVLSRDGSSARWMLNSLALTLTPRGAELA